MRLEAKKRRTARVYSGETIEDALLEAHVGSRVRGAGVWALVGQAYSGVLGCGRCGRVLGRVRHKFSAGAPHSLVGS